MAGEPWSHNHLAEAPLRFLDNNDLTLLLVGGKGGVGKTTTAAALSLYLAGKFPQRRYLAVSTGPSHSLGQLLDFPLDSCPRPVYGWPNLLALEVDAGQLFAGFKTRHERALRTILGRGTYLDDEDISRFLELSFPGLDELMAMIEIIDPLESGRYDTVIVDTAPTGHALRLLSLPALTTAWVSILDRMMEKHRFISRVYTRRYRKDQADEFLETLQRDVSRLAATLCDRRHCRFLAVALLEPVVIAETERLLQSLAERGIAVGCLLANQVLFQTNGCPLCSSLQAAQQEWLHRLMAAHPDLPLVTFPALLEEVRGEAGLRALLGRARTCAVSTASLGAGPPDSVLPIAAALSGLALPAPEPGLQFFLFCGKGGVGKTTLSCAFALQLSQRFPRKRILLFSTDPAHSLSDCLAQRIGPEATAVLGTANVFAIEIVPDALFQEWKRAYSAQIEEAFGKFSQRAGLDIQFDREVVAGLLDLTPPGLDELMCLSELADLVERRRYDLYVLDTAPAGHTLRFLELLTLVRDWLRTFFEILLKYRDIIRLPQVSESLVKMSQRAKEIRRIFTDPARCRAIPVTTPTRAAAEETQRLLTALQRSGIRFNTLIVNQVIVTPAAWGCCASTAAWHANQLDAYRSRFPNLDLFVLPRWPAELRGTAALQALLRFTSPAGLAPPEAVEPIVEQPVA